MLEYKNNKLSVPKPNYFFSFFFQLLHETIHFQLELGCMNTRIQGNKLLVPKLLIAGQDLAATDSRHKYKDKLSVLKLNCCYMQ